MTDLIELNADQLLILDLRIAARRTTLAHELAHLDDAAVRTLTAVAIADAPHLLASYRQAEARGAVTRWAAIHLLATQQAFQRLQRAAAGAPEALS